jgi:hypothetical protein
LSVATFTEGTKEAGVTGVIRGAFFSKACSHFTALCRVCAKPSSGWTVLIRFTCIPQDAHVFFASFVRETITINFTLNGRFWKIAFIIIAASSDTAERSDDEVEPRPKMCVHYEVL